MKDYKKKAFDSYENIMPLIISWAISRYKGKLTKTKILRLATLIALDNKLASKVLISTESMLLHCLELVNAAISAKTNSDFYGEISSISIGELYMLIVRNVIMLDSAAEHFTGATYSSRMCELFTYSLSHDIDDDDIDSLEADPTIEDQAKKMSDTYLDTMRGLMSCTNAKEAVELIKNKVKTCSFEISKKFNDIDDVLKFGHVEPILLTCIPLLVLPCVTSEMTKLQGSLTNTFDINAGDDFTKKVIKACKSVIKDMHTGKMTPKEFEVKIDDARKELLGLSDDEEDSDIKVTKESIFTRIDMFVNTLTLNIVQPFNVRNTFAGVANKILLKDKKVGGDNTNKNNYMYFGANAPKMSDPLLATSNWTDLTLDTAYKLSNHGMHNGDVHKDISEDIKAEMKNVKIKDNDDVCTVNAFINDEIDLSENCEFFSDNEPTLMIAMNMGK